MTAWIIFGILFSIFLGYAGYHVWKKKDEYLEMYDALYTIKEAEARKYLKEKQGFDKI